MNKETLRKELEDAMDWSLGYNFGDTQVWIRDRNTYITTRLAALDDGDGVRSEQEIRESLAEMERMTNAAENALNNPKVKETPVLLSNFTKWRERSSARASILKWVLGLPYLDELPPIDSVDDVDKESEISVEQLYAAGWVRKMDDPVFPIEKKIGNRNPLNASDDTNIELVVHGMYNSSQFAIQLPDGGLLNFNPRSLEDLKAFERMISFYDAPF